MRRSSEPQGVAAPLAVRQGVTNGCAAGQSMTAAETRRVVLLRERAAHSGVLQRLQRWHESRASVRRLALQRQQRRMPACDVA